MYFISVFSNSLTPLIILVVLLLLLTVLSLTLNHYFYLLISCLSLTFDVNVLLWFSYFMSQIIILEIFFSDIFFIVIGFA